MATIQDKDGNIIQSMEDWATIYTSGNKAKQWKEGRSAYSIADFVINHHGLEKIKSRVEEIIQDQIEIDIVIPENEIMFDSFRPGRVHDLGIYSKGPVFIGVESKVDEPFGPSISDAYLDSISKAIGGSRTNKPERIEKLLKDQFKKPDRSLFNLRYQLLYAVAGTRAAGRKKSILYTIVFKTDQYDDLKGVENFRDYLNFLQAVNAKEDPVSQPDSLVHRFYLRRKELISIYEQLKWK